MIPDFPHNIGKNKIGPIESFLLHPDDALSLPCWLSQFSLYYEESLVSSNLNSNLLRFYCVRPNLNIIHKYIVSSHELLHLNYFFTSFCSMEINNSILLFIRDYRVNLRSSIFQCSRSISFPISMCLGQYQRE